LSILYTVSIGLIKTSFAPIFFRAELLSMQLQLALLVAC
ncbi:MAG: hypothetical protein ACI9QD_000381, partial [Thermoproteota archaeon]